ncbi:helix-turn-helix transcriptional regulator [Salinicoccus sesuvii]|uniref:Helix-turn-helix transcriptional regulator n=1 Tax=Salinicoccus sesuvii TaxID=868281 RepID=A0ABV7N664_9STAP
MNRNKTVQECISYMEANLNERLTLESLSAYCGYSKYHFLRLFKSEVGITPSTYLRNRRIAVASVLLLETEMDILNIALYFQFQSQESFTRAFKEIYELPPAKYRKMMTSIISHKEDVSMENKNAINGWVLSGSHPNSFEMGLDYNTYHQGHASGYLKSMSIEGGSEFATMMQTFKADNYKSERLKLSCYIKTEEVLERCALWMRVDDGFGDVLQFDNMNDRPIHATTDWNHYSIVLDVPDSSVSISFGILLIGQGKVWVDDFEFVTVDDKTPTTNMDMSADLSNEPVNLRFELEE